MARLYSRFCHTEAAMTTDATTQRNTRVILAFGSAGLNIGRDRWQGEGRLTQMGLADRQCNAMCRMRPICVNRCKAIGRPEDGAGECLYRVVFATSRPLAFSRQCKES